MRLLMTPPREGSCVMCGNPVNEMIDLNIDENGKGVHEQCYLDRFIGKSDTASPLPRLGNVRNLL